VPIYSTGAGAPLLYGVIEQNVIFHAIVASQPNLNEARLKLSDERGLPMWSNAKETSQ